MTTSTTHITRHAHKPSRWWSPATALLFAVLTAMIISTAVVDLTVAATPPAGTRGPVDVAQPLRRSIGDGGPGSHHPRKLRASGLAQHVV